MGEKFSLALSPTLNTDSSAMSGHYDAVREPHDASAVPDDANYPSCRLHSSAAYKACMSEKCTIIAATPAQTLHGSSKAKTLADRYEYVMHGKIFKYRTTNAGGQLRVEVTISFGGLLLQMVGDATKLEGLELDTFIFLLIRKV